MTTTKPTNIDLGKTQITPLIRVSSAAIYYEDWPADYWLVSDRAMTTRKEWVVDDDAIQISAWRRIPMDGIDEAVRLGDQA